MLIGRFYLFASSVGLNAKDATAGSPPRGSGIILISHTVLERASVERSVVNKKNYERETKWVVVVRGR